MKLIYRLTILITIIVAFSLTTAAQEVEKTEKTESLTSNLASKNFGFIELTPLAISTHDYAISLGGGYMYDMKNNFFIGPSAMFGFGMRNDYYLLLKATARGMYAFGDNKVQPIIYMDMGISSGFTYDTTGLVINPMIGLKIKRFYLSVGYEFESNFMNYIISDFKLSLGFTFPKYR